MKLLAGLFATTCSLPSMKYRSTWKQCCDNTSSTLLFDSEYHFLLWFAVVALYRLLCVSSTQSRWSCWLSALQYISLRAQALSMEHTCSCNTPVYFVVVASCCCQVLVSPKNELEWLYHSSMHWCSPVHTLYVSSCCLHWSPRPHSFLAAANKNCLWLNTQQNQTKQKKRSQFQIANYIFFVSF